MYLCISYIYIHTQNDLRFLCVTFSDDLSKIFLLPATQLHLISWFFYLQMGDFLPPVDLGVAGRIALSVSCGEFHTCILLDDGSVK
jgi:hypothetical protein